METNIITIKTLLCSANFTSSTKEKYREPRSVAEGLSILMKIQGEVGVLGVKLIVNSSKVNRRVCHTALRWRECGTIEELNEN